MDANNRSVGISGPIVHLHLAAYTVTVKIRFYFEKSFFSADLMKFYFINKTRFYLILLDVP